MKYPGSDIYLSDAASEEILPTLKSLPSNLGSIPGQVASLASKIDQATAQQSAAASDSYDHVHARVSEVSSKVDDLSKLVAGLKPATVKDVQSAVASIPQPVATVIPPFPVAPAFNYAKFDEVLEAIRAIPKPKDVVIPPYPEVVIPPFPTIPAPTPAYDDSSLKDLIKQTMAVAKAAGDKAVDVRYPSGSLNLNLAPINQQIEASEARIKALVVAQPSGHDSLVKWVLGIASASLVVSVVEMAILIIKLK